MGAPPAALPATPWLSVGPLVLTDAPAAAVVAGLAGALPPGDLVRADRPAGGWAVAALIEGVLEPLRRAPDRCRVVVMELGTERLGPAVLARLLKPLEEPPWPTVVVITCPDPSELPAALRGRGVRLRVSEPRPELPATTVLDGPPARAATRLASARTGDDAALLRAVLAEARLRARTELRRAVTASAFAEAQRALAAVDRAERLAATRVAPAVVLGALCRPGA